MVTPKSPIPGHSQDPIDFRVLAAEISGHHEAMMQKFETISAKFDDVSHQMDSVVATLERHMDAEDKEIKIIKDTLTTAVREVREEVMQGFPNKDPIRHHDYHIDVIDDAADRKKRNQEIITFIMKSALWAFLVIVGTALWFYVKAQLKLP